MLLSASDVSALCQAAFLSLLMPMLFFNGFHLTYITHN